MRCLLGPVRDLELSRTTCFPVPGPSRHPCADRYFRFYRTTIPGRLVMEADGKGTVKRDSKQDVVVRLKKSVMG